MTEKPYYYDRALDKIKNRETGDDYWFLCDIADLLNKQDKTIKELEKDVDYWKQVASQYSNELNVFEHCKKYKTKCKDIYWSSDVE